MCKLLHKRISLVLLVLFAPGCTYHRLQKSITDQATTLADIHYQQVLNNLAVFDVNPNAMPSHVLLRDGSAQIQDFGQLAATIDFGRSMGNLYTGSPSATGSRTVVEQWGVSPVTDDIEIRIIRLAYQRSFGTNVFMDLDLLNDLARELGKQTAETSDIDQREFFSGSETFRERFAREYANQAFDKYVTINNPQERFNRFKLNLNEISTLDGYYKGLFVGTTDEEIILKEEFLNDPYLHLLKPNRYSPDTYMPGRPAPKDFAEAIIRFGETRDFTALARSVRREVKDTQDDLVKIGPGWFHTGTRHEVPKDACYVGRYKDRYAWVCPEGMSSLTNFTIAILKFSDLIKERAVLTVPGGPRFTPAAGR